ncbi:complement C3-like isoform X1 [Callorhinus ursinus]|uniref:complement C3-like isoform X1 n=1 Tax=Callorhinus ursinus TaxID=34884 RepID=UPI003CD0465C
MGPVWGDKVVIHPLDKTHWPKSPLDKNSLYTIEATAYALMQKVVLGRHNETHAIAKWLLEKRELGGGFKSTQTTVVALEALTHFREAVPFDGVQDLRVQISVPEKALDLEWIIDRNNAYQQRSAKLCDGDVEMYAFQYETKMNSSDNTVVLYLEKLSHKEDTVLGFRVHRMLQVEFLQAAQVTIYDYYEPSRRCSSFYNLPTEQSSLRKICHKDVCRCAEEQCPSPRKDNTRLRQEELQAAARETGVDFVYKVRLKSVKSSTSSPYIYYNMKLEDIIKRGTDSAVSLTMKKFISHATCHDSLGLQEQETYLIMGQISDMWKVKSECVGAPAVPGLSYIYVLGRKTFFMQWPTDGDVGKKELLDHLTGFSDYMSTHGCESWDSEVSTALRRLFPSRHRPLALTPNKEHGVSYPKSIHLSLLQHSSRTLHNQPQHCRDLPPPSPSYTISITLAFSVSFQHPS